MIRTITVAASIATAVALGACSRNDNAEYDSAAGATTGAYATPPAVTPAPIGMSTGATTSAIGMSTGATTTVDTTKSKTKRP
jgi:hypothetical protein